MSLLNKWMGTLGLLAASVHLGGCRTPAPATAVRAPSAQKLLSEGRRCEAPSDRPFVVEWAAADRAQFEARLASGVAVVAREGCEVRVLPRCTVDASYDFVALSPKREAVSIRNENELYARLPVGAARLEGQLARTGELVVDMAIRGQYQLHAGAPAQLSGVCEGATHLVTGATVGAFELRAGATRELSGEAVVPVGGVPVGGGGSHESMRELLTVDGDLEGCAAGSAAAGSCEALVQIELGPLPAGQAGLASAAEDSERLQRKAKGWKAVSTTSGVLAGASLGGAVAGAVILSRADWDDMGTAVWEESDPDVKDRKQLGTALLAGSMAGTAVFSSLAIAARVQAYRLDARRYSLGVAANGQGGGVVFSGRF